MFEPRLVLRSWNRNNPDQMSKYIGCGYVLGSLQQVFFCYKIWAINWCCAVDVGDACTANLLFDSYMPPQIVSIALPL